MKTIFNPGTAMTIVVVAVTLSLVSFSDADRVPADLATSKVIVQKAGFDDVGIGPIPLPITVLQRQLILQRLLLTTATRFQDYPGPIIAYDKQTSKSVKKTIQAKMKALG